MCALFQKTRIPLESGIRSLPVRAPAMAAGAEAVLPHLFWGCRRNTPTGIF